MPNLVSDENDMSANQFQQVTERLQHFTKRYYLNELLKSSAVFLSVSLLLITTLSITEFFLRNESPVRASLFYASLILETAGLVYFILLPLLKVLGMGRVMTDLESANLVGKRVHEIDDKLLNAIQLSKMDRPEENELLKAALNQKASKLLPIPFQKSASFKRGLVFLRYTGVVLGLAVVLGWTFPDVINYGTRRLVFYERNLEPPAPFKMEVSTDDLVAIKHEPLEIKIEVSGSLLPKELFIALDEQHIIARKEGYSTFVYTFKHIRDPFRFRVFAEGYYSKEYQVKVVERPSIVAFGIQVEYPAYLGLKNEIFRNQGNLTVPEGSKLNWNITAQSGAEVCLDFEESSLRIPVLDKQSSFDSIFLQTSRYQMLVENGSGLKSDSINYLIEVVKDAFPAIEVELLSESSDNRSVHLGKVSDDHGISSIRLGYKLNDERQVKFKDIQTNGKNTSQEFIYELNWQNWELKEGDRVTYFFEVRDNDVPHGRKAAKSRQFEFGLPEMEELVKQKDELADQMTDDLEKALKEARELNKEIQDMKKDLLVDEKKMDWNQQKKLKDIVEKRQDLLNELRELEKKQAQKNKFENKLNRSPEMLQKHQDLLELMEKLMDEEMMELLKELAEKMEEMNKEQLNETMEKMELSSDELEKQLDRSLELFKQLEFEQKLDDVVQELDELQEDQKKLGDQVKEGVTEEKKQEQDELKDRFEKVEQKIDELNEMNEGLEQKHEVGEMKEEREEVKKEQQEAQDAMQKNQKKKAGENQKKAGEQMEQMKNNLKSLQMQMQSQAMEDIKSLRNTLENLVELSFDQERLIDEMKGIRMDDPRFRELTRDQRGALDALKIVEDSLQALSKRVAQIKPTVDRELGASKQSMEKSLKFMTERKMGDVQMQQQLAMTSINNLAVLMDEIIEQMQNQMMMPSSGQCQKPGQSKPNSSSLKQMQEKLNKQLQEMKKMQEQGKSPGKSGEGGKMPAESLAKMAAEQAKIREALKEMQKNASQNEARELEKIGDLMEETEKDIVNRNLTRETLMRQEKILTRLLESERAERERDMDEKRESEQGEEKIKGNLLNLEEYYKARNIEHERLIKENFSYNQFYREKIEDYLKSISE